MYGAYTNELKEAGARVRGPIAAHHPDQHHPGSRRAAALTTDGPFTEAKEHLGGFYLIHAADQHEANAWAAKCPGAQYGVIEVRPIWE